MKYLVVFIFIFYSSFLVAQQSSKKDTDSLVSKTFLKGNVLHEKTLLPLEFVHIVNASKLKVDITNSSGKFEVEAEANDTLVFSFVGFETYTIKVTNDLLKNEKNKILMTEKVVDLNEVVLTQIPLTGYLEVDTKLIPVNENYRANIIGITGKYEVGDSKSPNAIGRVVGAILNPVDFLNNTFSKKTAQIKKLKQFKKDDTIRNLLATKYDREMIAALLEISKEDIGTILQKCNYSEEFILTANDLQILDAINGCYEEHKSIRK